MVKYSFIVPIFNDGYLAADFCESYLAAFQGYLHSDQIEHACELIFVDDGSEDGSADTLTELASRYAFVKVISLSRNFGQHIALSCGYRHARGSYVGMINVDGQEPADQIPVVLEHIERGGCDIVFGLRTRRAGSLSERFTSRAFGLVLNKLTGYAVPLNVATIRVMNRRFVDAYNRLSESSRYLPGLESWLGFRRGYVPVTHTARLRGKSSYDFSRRLSMAADAVISFSDLPLRMTALLGFAIVALSFVLASILTIQKLFFIRIQLGYTSTVCLILFLGGTQLSVVGMASLYIGRILREVQRRPLYVIRDAVNVERQDSRE
jgi:dolichol-phosphate mannosyltransferase